jgi:hypothetical protein
MTALPNLAGVASKELVETIGSGKFSAAYINWSRTMNLLRQHAPGWLVDYVPTKEGSLLHQAPVGAYLLIRFLDMETGFSTPALPQAVMDHRNNAIPFEKITARDVTDTQRRGMCMAAAMHFGLAYELWAKMPMENGFQEEGASSPAGEVATPPLAKAKPTKEAFMEECIAKGLTTYAINGIIKIVDGDLETGLKTVNQKTPEQIEGLNEKFAPKSESSEDGNW